MRVPGSGTNVAVISQMTFSMERFYQIVERIKEKLRDSFSIEIVSKICDATSARQEETTKIAKEVDLMIIIGGRHSSNTNKLYELACKYCKNNLLIETKDELDIDSLKNFKKIGIMAGVSTPRKSIEEVVEIMKDL